MRNIPFGGSDDDDDEEFDAMNILDIIEQSIDEAIYEADRNQKIMAHAIKFVTANPLMRLMPINHQLEQLRKVYQVIDEITEYEE